LGRALKGIFCSLDERTPPGSLWLFIDTKAL
jgi:hypothetical protein